jgi:hypothetical protein
MAQATPNTAKPSTAPSNGGVKMEPTRVIEPVTMTTDSVRKGLTEASRQIKTAVQTYNSVAQLVDGVPSIDREAAVAVASNLDLAVRKLKECAAMIRSRAA